MNDETNWKALKAERSALLDSINALPFDSAWQRVRTILEASPSLSADGSVPTVYEGPTRSSLLPLPFELLQSFIKNKGGQAADCVFEHVADAHPLVAAYCLHSLLELEDKRLTEAVTMVAGRSERIRSLYGCFGWEGTLSEYGLKLHAEYIKAQEHERSKTSL